MPTQPHPGAGMQGTFYFIQEDYRMVDYLRVGVITSPHGLRGDVKVFPTTDDVNRFKKLKKAYIDTGKEKMPVTVEQVRFFKNMVILKLFFCLLKHPLHIWYIFGRSL